MRIVIALVCVLSFISAHSSTSTIRAQVSNGINKAKIFFNYTVGDKLLPLHKITRGAMAATLIYAGGMFPTAAVGDRLLSYPSAVVSNSLPSSRRDEMVIISQNNDEMLLMPVRDWLPQEGAFHPLIVSPTLVHNLALTLTKFIVTNEDVALSKILRYWDLHLGKRGGDLQAALEAVRLAVDEGQLEISKVLWGVRAVKYEGYPFEILKQRLAFLTLVELTASLNAALSKEGRGSRSGISRQSKLSLIARYLESGYVTVERDSGGRAKVIHPHLYNYNSEGELLATETETHLHLPLRTSSHYDRAMNMAIINKYNGIVFGLLAWSDEYDLRQHLETAYDLHQHLETAKELGQDQIVNVLLARIQHNRNRALKKAAGVGDLLRIKALLASRSEADDLNGALKSAMLSGETTVVDFLVAFGGIDFNEGLLVAAELHDPKEMERFIKLGADNFDEALQRAMLTLDGDEHDEAEMIVELLIDRATDVDAVLEALLQSYYGYEYGFTAYVVPLVRRLIRAGADDLEGALEFIEFIYEKEELKMLRELFTEGGVHQNPVQLQDE